jgi:hypothetical protein
MGIFSEMIYERSPSGQTDSIKICTPFFFGLLPPNRRLEGSHFFQKIERNRFPNPSKIFRDYWPRLLGGVALARVELEFKPRECCGPNSKIKEPEKAVVIHLAVLVSLLATT